MTLKAVDRHNSFACVKLRWGAFLCGGSSVPVKKKIVSSISATLTSPGYGSSFGRG